MKETINQTLLDLKARQLKGERMACPRCGQDSMNPAIHRNALSRHADVYICDDCGTAEALLEMMQNPLPLVQWACFQAECPRTDFEALPGTIAWERLLKEQVPYLIQLFERCQGAQAHDDFEACRLDAHRHCAGLTALWSQPFQAAYRVADGQLLLRFRATENGTEVAYDIIPEPRR